MKFLLLIRTWHWRSRSIFTKNNKDLNQGALHFWSKFGGPSSKPLRSYGADKLGLTHTHTDGHTDRQTQATTIPESQNWSRENKTNLRDLIAATGLVTLLKLDSNRQFFSPCDLEIWWMTLKNNRAPLLCYFKFVHHFIAIGELKLE